MSGKYELSLDSQLSSWRCAVLFWLASHTSSFRASFYFKTSFENPYL